MTAPQHIAVIDIGKTNVKLALVDLATRAEVAVTTRANTVLPGPPYLHFDTDGHWAFLLDALARFHRDHGIDAISITTHGACAALLAADGTLAAPVLDYEHPGPDTLRADYDAIRPPFAETGSARLPMGLNVGAQLFWQFQTDPDLLPRVAHLVTWPQYWAHRLTGIAATDVTSLGCHTDLWNPYAGRPSALVQTLGLTGRIAPARRSGDLLGTILPALAAQTGLRPGTPVACGIHDSNASLLPHLLDRSGPFSVVSTGTWVVVMTMNGAPVTLNPDRDTLVNVNALGQPVPSARFMGGREYELIRAGKPPLATTADADSVLTQGLMLLPSVQTGSGPFPNHPMRWHPDEPTDDAAREVALGWYLALMTAECLAITGALGPAIIEGPFARNPFFRDMLAAATGRAVLASPSQTGTAVGAALLFAQGAVAPVPLAETVPADPRLVAYARDWRARV
ncbi:MAG: FGGY-family carbohydrate kinase [Pseudomonadota bacterium]